MSEEGRILMGFGVPEAISQIHEHYAFTCNAVRRKFVLKQFDSNNAKSSMEQIGKICISWGIDFVGDCMFLGMYDKVDLEEMFYIKLKDFYRKSHSYENVSSVCLTRESMERLLKEIEINTYTFCVSVEHFFDESEKYMDMNLPHGKISGLNEVLCDIGKKIAVKEWIDVKKALQYSLTEREDKYDRTLGSSWISAEMHL